MHRTILPTESIRKGKKGNPQFLVKRGLANIHLEKIPVCSTEQQCEYIFDCAVIANIVH